MHSIKIVEIRAEKPIDCNVTIDGVLHYWRRSYTKMEIAPDFINEFVVPTET